MSLIQTPWTSQPQQAVGIDWSNPITNGLIDAWSAIASTITNAGKSGAESGGSYLPQQRGLFRKWATSSDGVDLGNNKLALPTTGNHSCFAIVTWPSANWKWAAHFQSGGDNILFGKANTFVGLSCPGVGDRYLFGFTPTAGRTYAIGFSFVRGSDVRLMYYEYETGTYVTSLESSITPATSASNTWIGRRSTTTEESFSGTGAGVQLVVPFSRAITESDFKSLSQNPWQIFKPIPRRIFVPVAAGDATGTGSFYDVTLSSPTGTASGTGAVNGTGTGDFAASSLAAPSATATGSALATGALTTVTLTTITASATGSALATGSLDAIDLSTVSGSATGTTAGNAEGVGSVATIALSAPAASAVGSALATGSFAHVSLSAVSGTASAATNGQATADLQPISISAPLAIAIASSVATGGIQSIGLTAPTGSASGQAQTIARPGTDTSNSGWTPSTGSDLYSMLDEVTPDDADYISAASAGSVCRLGLGAVADPGTSSGQVVSYRASSSTGNGLKVELMQGGTVIATWNHATLPATDTTYQQSLSAAECDAITDYTALSVRLTSL